MKKGIFVFVAIFVLLLSTSASAIEWVQADEKMIYWDPVTTYANGDPVEDGATVTYVCYLKADGASDVERIDIGETAETQFLTNVGTEGKWIVGVATKRTINEDVILSSITWSNSTDTTAVPNPFGILFLRAFAAPSGLRDTPEPN